MAVALNAVVPERLDPTHAMDDKIKELRHRPLKHWSPIFFWVDRILTESSPGDITKFLI